MPCRRVMRAVGQRATAAPVGRFCHLEVIHASDMLNDAVAGVVPVPGLPSPADKSPAGAGWLHEIKRDGPAPARGGHGYIRQQWRRE
jgi:hypothetical protein